MIERHVEAALVMDGLDPQTILAKRDEIRGFLFYPHGKLLSSNTYHHYLQTIDLQGTRACMPYRRVIKALHNLDLLL